jgi:hypothetical protein
MNSFLIRGTGHPVHTDRLCILLLPSLAPTNTESVYEDCSMIVFASEVVNPHRGLSGRFPENRTSRYGGSYR